MRKLTWNSGNFVLERNGLHEWFSMKSEFTAIIEQDGEWFIAYCPEIPGANGQGKTRDEARENLAEAIVLILTDQLSGC